MPGVIVSDTSCLILLSKIGELDLLSKLFGKILISNTVLNEFNQPIPKWIEVVELKKDGIKELPGFLDAGEASSIALALVYENSLLIVDEIKGRKAAKELGITVTGSLGVLVEAKNRGHLKAVKPVINKIRKTNFHVADALIDRVLEKANEL